MAKRLVITISIVAVVAAAAVTATQARWSGGLGGRYGNSVGVPTRVGVPFSVGMIQLRARHRVRIESVRLHQPSVGVAYLGAGVHPANRGMVGTARGFPPSFPRVRMRRASGTVIPAGTTLLLVIGLRATHVGGFRVRGVDLLYRERWHGIDIRRKAHIGVEVDGCAVRASARRIRCSPPQPIF